MEDLIIIVILSGIVGLAAWYVIRAKRRGVKCIGCSVEGCSSKKNDGDCGGNCRCCCGCGITLPKQTDDSVEP